MAIQPIDLQTLFTQVDKVGKTQSAQQEGLSLQQTMQGARIEKKNEALMQTVTKAQDSGEGPDKIKDRGAGRQESDGKPNSSAKKDADAKDADADAELEAARERKNAVFKDPTLGRNIDISL